MLALRRFNTSVQFGLPDEACRGQILQQYAKHLKEEDLAMLAKATSGLAGRDLKDLSEQAERRWASKVIKPPCILAASSLLVSQQHQIPGVLLNTAFWLWHLVAHTFFSFPFPHPACWGLKRPADSAQISVQ